MRLSKVRAKYLALPSLSLKGFISLQRTACTLKVQSTVIYLPGVQTAVRAVSCVSPCSQAHVYRRQVCSSITEALDTPYAYVLVATKVLPSISPTSKLVAPLLSPETYKFPQPAFVLLQNGLGIEEDLYEAAASNLSKPGSGEAGVSPRIVSCTIFIATNLISERVVEHMDFVRALRIIQPLRFRILTLVGYGSLG